MEDNEITKTIIGCAIEVHKILGPGLLESAYEECLLYELRKKKLKVIRQLSLPIIYKDIKLNHGYRIDLLVEDKVVVELKTVECFNDVHSAQILTYMRLGKYKIGLLLNFNVKILVKGVKRFVL